MALLNVENLTVGYDNKPVAKPITFSVEKQDYLCIVGENGSGKTTLMKTILGLQTAISGDINYDDGLSKNEIGYLPQQSDVQRDFPASVREIVLSGCQSHLGLRPFYKRTEKQQAMECMNRMGIASLAKRSYRELSGGQQQRVLLARALMATEKLLLLDEPVAGLDPKATDDMYRLISELNHKGISIIMISHDIEEALSYSSHVLHIGKDIFFGTNDEYLKRGKNDD